jgi:3-ketosteroid 9alpha-monooxygenase subunit B
MPTEAVSARHQYHPLRVRRIVPETSQARSIVFDVPSELADVLAYEAGQFVTIRAVLGGETHLRSYSMSSSPEVDGELRVTVKRVPGGLVSNWLNDAVAEGDVLDVQPPGGAFVLDQGGHDIVAFAAGSGITPVFSLVKTALSSTGRRVRLLYANRSRAEAIFGDALDALAAAHPDRLTVEHHEDLVRGFVDGDTVARYLGDAVYYLCGPAGFMDTVESALRERGASPARVHIERFTPAEQPAPAAERSVPGAAGPAAAIEVIIKLGGKTTTAAHRGDATILQTARFAGLRAPSSCETGSCATCMARVVRGHAVMRNNDALTPDEVAEGWVLTCQAVPLSPVVAVVYE